MTNQHLSIISNIDDNDQKLLRTGNLSFVAIFYNHDYNTFRFAKIFMYDSLCAKIAFLEILGELDQPPVFHLPRQQ